jgi:hypothetical protein
VSDRECFDFLKEINYDKQWFLDRGWALKYFYDHDYKGGPMWWPASYKDEPEDPEDYYTEVFPPGFKLQEGYGKDDEDYPAECCANCINSRSEYSYGCRLVEVIVACDSTVLKGKQDICPGHSNPCFTSDVKYAPHAICSYFKPRGLSYQI